MEPGTPIRCRMTKWGERPHWRFDGTLLGADEHGRWVGFPVGSHHARPGFSYDSDVDSVTLVPHDGWFLATFHAPGIWCDLYVDITTPAVLADGLLTAVDLDLDVIRMSPDDATRPGEVFVDDEDEFAEHQVAFGYPDDVIGQAEASCARVLEDVTAGRAPFDGTHQRWLEALQRAQ